MNQHTSVDQRPVTEPVQTHRQFSPSRLQVIIAVVAILLLGFAISWLYFKGQQRIMTDRYQAVHLENGQVFFGKLQNTSGNFLTLRDAYYTPLQQVKPDSQQKTPTQLSLIKVGEEVYGPERSVSIARSTVQYWENLRSDSKVIDAIKQQQ